MKLQEFDFHLPEHQIAQTPASPRDHAKLFYINKKTKEHQHLHFYNLPSLLKKGDVVVRNNSKVFPARLFAIKEGVQKPIEIFLLRKQNEQPNKAQWEALLRPGKKAKERTVLTLQHSEINVHISKKHKTGTATITLQAAPEELAKYIEKHGQTPLPPYIQQKETAQIKESYQTTFAKHEGSVAAPTAGLHFTEKIDAELLKKGVEIIEITLHVGIGTFRPVKTEHIEDHEMHAEYFEITKENWEKIAKAKQEKRRIIGVGTTSIRTLESCGITAPTFKNSDYYSAETTIYITPKHQWKIANGMITNFHLPKSSLIILVSSLLGHKETMAAYKEAIKESYRFYSFGDAMLII